jgi:hypothetical protein
MYARGTEGGILKIEKMQVSILESFRFCTDSIFVKERDEKCI